MTVGAVTAQLRLDMTNFREGLAKANSLLEQHKQQAARAATVLAGFAAAAAAGLGVAIKWSAEFEGQMRNVNSILQETEPNFRALSEAVLSLAGKTGQAPAVLARGLYDIASSGFAGADGLKVLEAAAKAATAGLSTTAVASRAITAVLNAYGMNASQAAHVSDVLFKTVERGVITFEELAQNVGDVVAMTATANIKFEEVGAAIAAMTRAGIQPAEAFTSLNMVIRSIINPTAEATAAAAQLGIQWDATALASKGVIGMFKGLGVEFKTRVKDIDALRAAGASEAQIMAIVAENAGIMVTQLAALFPEVRALRGALVLASQAGEIFSKEMEYMAEASGSTARALAEQSKSLAVAWQKAWATIQGVFIGAAGSMLPLLKGLTDSVRLLAELSRGIPKPIQAAAVAVIALAAGLAGLTAALILWNTQMRLAIPLMLGMVVTMRQMLVSLAATRVGISGIPAVATAAATSMKGLAASFMAATASISPGLLILGALLAVVIKAGSAAVQAAVEVDDFNASLLKLEDRAQTARSAMQRFPEELKLTWLQAFLQHLTPFEGEITRLRREQMMLFEGGVELAEKRAAAENKTAKGIEQARARLKALAEGETKQQLADIEALRQARIKQGWDATLANRTAAEDRRAVEQKATVESLKFEAEIAQAKGRTHDARMFAFQAEAKEWQQQNEQRLGKDKAAAEAERLKGAKIIALTREEAEAKAKAFEEKVGSYVSTWRGLLEGLREAGQLDVGEYLAGLARILAFIQQARAVAGQPRLREQEELQLAQTIFSERKRMQTELEAGEKRLADEKKAWGQEELDQRRRLHDYERSLLDLTYQYRRDLATAAGEDDEETLARIARDEWRALRTRREEEHLTAQERLESLQRENQLVLEMQRGGEMGEGAARGALAEIFAEMKRAKEEIAGLDRTAFAERQAQHDQTVKQIETEQTRLRDQLSQTGGHVVQVAQQVFAALQQHLQAVASVRLQPALGGAAAAGGGGAGGQRTYNFYIGGRQVTGGMDINRIADQLAEMLVRDHTFRRD